jgi:hypothetical protein
MPGGKRSRGRYDGVVGCIGFHQNEYPIFYCRYMLEFMYFNIEVEGYYAVKSAAEVAAVEASGESLAW